MTNKKNLMMLLGIAFVVAIIATGLFYGLVVNRLNDAATVNRDSVAVAARPLEPGVILTAADVKMVPRGQVDALVSGFDAPESVSGLVVMAPIGAGEAIDRTLVASKTSAHGAAAGVPSGMRAVSIHVADSSGVVAMLQAGHRVDAQIVTNSNRRGGTTLRTVLQNLEVLRVEPEPETSEGRPFLPVVTLLGTPEEVDALALGDAAARIRLVLRHPLDPELTERPSVALAAVLENPPKQEPRGPTVSRGGADGSEQPAADAVETASHRAASPAASAK